MKIECVLRTGGNWRKSTSLGTRCHARNVHLNSPQCAISENTLRKMSAPLRRNSSTPIYQWYARNALNFACILENSSSTRQHQGMWITNTNVLRSCFTKSVVVWPYHVVMGEKLCEKKFSRTIFRILLKLGQSYNQLCKTWS